MGGAIPFISAIAPILGSVFGGKPSAPPPPPQYSAASAPAPEPASESKAADVATAEPVLDTEAAKLRADKRKRATQEAANALISLGSTSPTTKATSLLGE